MRQGILADDPGGDDSRYGDTDVVASNELPEEWSQLGDAEAPGEGSAEQAKVGDLKTCNYRLSAFKLIN